MKGLNVLYLTHYAELYGANRSLLDLVSMLHDQGAVRPFVVMAGDGALRVELDRRGIDHAIVPFVSWMHKRVYMGGPHHRLLQRMRYRQQARGRDRTNRTQQQAVVELARGHGCQLVHTNSSVIGIGGGVARELGVPHVWHIRELPFLHYGFSVDGGMRRYARELRQASGIIALSQAVVDDMRALIPSTDRIELLPDGVVTESQWMDREPFVQECWRRTDVFEFLLAALFHPSKGQEEAVNAFAGVHRRFPHTRLCLAGGGRSEGIRDLVARKGLEHAVRFTGFVDDIFTLMDRSHALLQCSRHEALGRVTLEAMVNGMPVIGHASGATPELIADGVTGLLYSTAGELMDHMCRLVTDRDLAEHMGMAGRARIPGHYTVDAMAGRTLSVYERCMNGR